jgi:hypothetical protein
LLRQPLTELVRSTQQPALAWLFWQPAFLLYVLLGGTVIGCLRARSLRLAYVVLPFLLQSLVMLVFYVSPHARYQYPVHLGSLLFAGWLYLGMPRRDGKLLE